jgi:hypothetical protein
MVQRLTRKKQYGVRMENTAGGSAHTKITGEEQDTIDIEKDVKRLFTPWAQEFRFSNCIRVKTWELFPAEKP